MRPPTMTTTSTKVLSILCLVLCLLAWTAEAARPKGAKRNLALNVTCEPSVIDNCATTLFVFGRRDVYLPKNYVEMVPHCQEEYDAEDCIKAYSRKCFGPFERQLTGMLMLGAGQVLRKRCSEEGTAEYLGHYRCIFSTIETMHDLMDQLIYTLMEIGEITDSSAKIPMSCCSFARFVKHASSVLRAECGPYDPAAEKYIAVKTIRGYVGDVLDLSCQGYDGSKGADKCSRFVLPLGGYEFKNNTVVKIRGAKLPKNKPKSIVGPMLQIFSTKETA